MTGYRGDVLVTVLRLDEFGQINFPKIKISEVTDEDYVRIVYLPNRSITYVKGCLSSSDYNDSVNFITLSDDQHLICCKDQNLLTCTYFHPDCLPIIDEKTFDQLTEDNVLAKATCLCLIGAEENESIDNYVERVEKYMEISFDLKKLEIMDNREQFYEGRIYNLDLPIEYALLIDNDIIVTTNHEHEGWI